MGSSVCSQDSHEICKGLMRLSSFGCLTELPHNTSIPAWLFNQDVLKSFQLEYTWR